MQGRAEIEERENAPAGTPDRLARAARTDRGLLARSSVTFLSRGLAKFGQVFFLVVAARLLSVEEFAEYSYLIVLASAFTIMSDTGVPLVASRDASAGRAQLGDLYRAALPIVVVSSLAAAAVLPILGAVDSGPGESLAPVALTAAFVVFNRYFDLVGELLRGVGRFTLEALLQLGGAIAFIAGATALMVAGYGVTAVMAVFALKELGCCLVGYMAIRSDLRRRRGDARRSSWRGLLRIGIHLSVAGIALALSLRVPLGVLGNTGTATEVALFSAAGRFGDGAYVLAITAGFALLPGIAFLASAEPARARRLLARVFAGVVAASAALGVVIVPLADHIMRLVFGEDFVAGAEALRIVGAGLPAYAGLGICWYAIVAFGGEARLLAVGAAGLALCVALSLAIIPSGGDEGAAWASTASIYVTAGLSLVALRRQLRATAAADP